MRRFAGGDGDRPQVMRGADFFAPLLKEAGVNFRFGRLPKTRKATRPAFANVWIPALITMNSCGHRGDPSMRKKSNAEKKQIHRFTLILSGLSRLSDKLENNLYDAGCNDALLGTRDGVVYLDFDREAPSFREAVSSAIGDVNKAGYEVVETNEEAIAACISPQKKRSTLTSLAKWFRSKTKHG